MWVQRGKVFVGALPMERKWQVYRARHLCCMLINLGAAWWCLPKIPGKMLHCPHFPGKEDYVVSNWLTCTKREIWDHVIPLGYSRQSCTNTVDPEGLGRPFALVRCSVLFREPCQLASIPADGEKRMPLPAPVFAFLFSVAVEDGNVRH